MFYTVFFIYCVISARQDPGNVDQTDLFLPNTFIGGGDPCAKYTGRPTYIQQLASVGIHCAGKWCAQDGANNGFGWASTDESYDGSHIVDVSNSNNDCNKEILGNVVMAYGKWNNMVGQLLWKDVRREKMRVYGDIFGQAVRNVLMCNERRGVACNFTDDTMEFLHRGYIGNCPGDVGAVGIIIGTSFLIVFVVMVVLVVYFSSKIQRRDDRYEVVEEF